MNENTTQVPPAEHVPVTPPEEVVVSAEEVAVQAVEQEGSTSTVPVEEVPVAEEITVVETRDGQPADYAEQPSGTLEPSVVQSAKDRPEFAAAVQAQKGAGRFTFTKRAKIITAAVAGVVVLVGGIGAFVLAQGKPEAQVAVTKQSTAVTTPKLGLAVTVADGTVTFQHGSGAWEKLTTASQLAEGDSVKTAGASRAVLTLDDGSALRLDADTTVKLVSLAADDVKIGQTAGMAYSRVVPSSRSYTVSVDNVQYKAMGTAFSTVNTTKDKGVQVYQSSVKVSDVTDAVTEGKQYYTDSTDANAKKKVVDINLDSLAGNSFIQWNLSEDQKVDTFKDKMGVLTKVKELAEQKAKEAESQTSQTTQGASITLTGSASGNSAALKWSLAGVSAPNGFKLVRSTTTSAPTYGKDEYAYVSDASARSYTWKSDTSGTYWFRVCAYQPSQGSCTNYSNAVKLSVTKSASEDKPSSDGVTRGTMKVSLVEGTKVSWTYTGKAPYGYKIVSSKTNNAPTYPEDNWAYISDSSASQGNIPTNQGKGTYYVRVCAYTNYVGESPCVDYSNTITVTKN